MADEQICPQCGTSFTSRSHAPVVYCGYRCSATARETKLRGGPLPTKTCEQCGIEFPKNQEYSYAVWEKIQYCSNRCKGLAARREKVCASCGVTFRGKNGRRSQAYCSRVCYWLSLRTERYPVRNRRRGQEFSFRVRRQLIERANGICEWCDATKHLEFDHVIPCHLGGTSEISNGQVLCQSCHRSKTAREIAELFTQ